MAERVALSQPRPVAFGELTLRQRLVVLPGLGGSGADHWQSVWEAAHPDAGRFAPSSVDQPDLEDWIGAVDRAVTARPERPVLVAHSLGTIAATAWMRLHPTRARAALLVAPPDPARADAPVAIRGFVPAARAVAAVPVTVIASRDDPYGSFDHAQEVAASIGAELVDAGERGHLNAASGLGPWDAGAAHLEAVIARALA